MVGPCPGGKATRGRADAWTFLARSEEASLEQGQLQSLMSLKVTSCFKWELWMAVLAEEGGGSGCLGQARVSLLRWSHGTRPGAALWSWHGHSPWHSAVNRQLVMCRLSYVVGAGELWVQPQAGKTAW